MASVLGLAVDAEGSLWIRLAGPTLIRYRNGVFEDATLKLGMPYSNVTALGKTTKGGLLIARLENGVVTYEHGRFKVIRDATPAARSPVISVAQTANGDIWMGTRDAGLFRMAGASVVAVPDRLPDSKINFLLPEGGERIWVATDDGVAVGKASRPVNADPIKALRGFQALSMLRDGDGNLWIGSDSRGLIRLNASGVAFLGSNGNESREAITALFEDREGNIWIGRSDSIERLREAAFVTYSQAEGLPATGNTPLLPGSDGRIWLAPSPGVLQWLDNGQQGSVRLENNSDVIYSIAGDSAELWLGRRRGGLTCLRRTGAGFASRTYTTNHGLAADNVYAVHQSRDGTVWAGTLTAGVSRLRDGRVETFTAARGLASNTVTSILEGSDGTMWFATAAGITSFSKGDGWKTYDIKAGLPAVSATSLLEDSKGLLWAGTAAGLAYYGSGKFLVPGKVPAVLKDQILGIAEDRLGWLWIATPTRVLRVTRHKLLEGALSAEDVREYGIADGLKSTQGVKRHRSVVTDTHGRIWLSTFRGISVVNPSRLASGGAPAVTRIEGLSADGNPIRMDGSIRIPAGHRRITITYAGLSLSVPERIRFRYRLEEFDSRWSGVVAAREAVYTNLGPGTYTFQVVASSSEGLWNSSESTLRFHIEPAYWQTWWFRSAAVLMCTAGVFGFYRYRLHGVTVRMNQRFEERLAERTRVAQELHDTLLQGFLSAWMRLHVLDDQIPDDSPAKPTAQRIIGLVGRVIEEGRNAVKGLRSPELAGQVDVGQAFLRIQQELELEPSIDMRVSVVGEPQPLRAVARDDIYHIGREALINAFRHSEAQNIEVRIDYTSADLRLIVIDNGSGMEPRYIADGREGHWGLQGMRERATRIGARLLLSSSAAGTKVELIVPGRIAFESAPDTAGRKRWKRWVPKRLAHKFFTPREDP
jgi:signal transduction histidine kinase/ligand-binding sensor domain-containing protein